LPGQKCAIESSKNTKLKKNNELNLSGKCNIGGNVTIDKIIMTSPYSGFYDVSVGGSHHLLFSKSEKPETVQYLE